MSATPKVSVLIPTYNYAHYLDEAIQSVLDQTFADFELVIVDNCSSDNTDEVVRKYLTDSRVSFHKNETNLGLVGNWNKCLEHAHGEYIKILCADDKLHPQLLENFVPVMDQHPNVSIVGSHCEAFGDYSLCWVTPFVNLIKSEAVRRKLLTFNWLRNPTVVMFRSKDAKTIGGFHPQLHQLLDWEYYMRLLNLGDCYIVPSSLSYVRVHADRQSAKFRRTSYTAVFEKYTFITSVSQQTPKTDPLYAEINADLKKKAIRCAAVMYEMLPGFYKRENRKIFKIAYGIGASKGVLLAPILHYSKLKFIKN